jgi:LruC domain-containing protein
MKKFFWFVAISMAIGAMLTSCKKNLFDPDFAKEALKLTFHNDVVDPDHTWSLMNDYTVSVTANVEDVERVEILSQNPYTAGEKSVEVMAQRDVTEGETFSLAYSVPSVNDSVYVAAVTSDGRYRVVAMESGTSSIDFSKINTKNTGKLSPPVSQEVYYCFCNSFPQPSATWSFTDCVMRLSKEVIDEQTFRIYVTLVAMGCSSQVAAALRLDGISYDDVESVNISNGKTFNRYEGVRRTIIRDDNTMLKGQDGSLVINLFDDGHLAFTVNVDDAGVVTRYITNVTHNTDETHKEFSPVTVSYDVKFKKRNVPYQISFIDLDPFILYNYNNNVWEVHKYVYKFKETLYSYYSGSPSSYDTGFTWALEVPYKWFRYPLLNISMGSYKNGVIYGAYQQPYHSFGEWGEDMDVARDWYLYPSPNVY